MKKLFVSLVAMVCATMSYAQGSLLATLSHDGTITTYYGSSALASAHEAAVSGDVITLSSGQFSAVNITKPITLRGAGMSVSNDSIAPHESTIIQGTFDINLADTLEGRLTMEGLYMNNAVTNKAKLKNAQFLKCRFYSFLAASGSTIENTSFIHSRIFDNMVMNNNSNATFINSIVRNPVSEGAASAVEFDNCVISFCYDYRDDCSTKMHNTYYKNCIIQNCYRYTTGRGCIPSNCVAFNSIGLGDNNIFDYILIKNTTNTYVSDIKTIFKTYSNTSNNLRISDSEFLELTDEAKTKYLGTDGTQVGIYGGNLTYNENPTTPQITKCNVAAKSTADGKLSVDIEVKAADY